MSNQNKNVALLVNLILDLGRSIITETNASEKLNNYIVEFNSSVKFGEYFYFIRHEFCKLNFIVGARCSNDEILWSGLAKNLIEELGGKNGITHNQLYRDFLKSVGARPEEELECPAFAREFNHSWEEFARTAPLMDALSAIAIYEILDVPDYQMFLEILERAKVPEEGLIFFRVHANAHHFEMFEDTVAWILTQEGGQAAFDRAKDFVFETQRKMWIGLTECLEAKQLVTTN